MSCEEGWRGVSGDDVVVLRLEAVSRAPGHRRAALGAGNARTIAYVRKRIRAALAINHFIRHIVISKSKLEFCVMRGYDSPNYYLL